MLSKENVLALQSASTGGPELGAEALDQLARGKGVPPGDTARYLSQYSSLTSISSISKAINELFKQVQGDARRITQNSPNLLH